MRIFIIVFLLTLANISCSADDNKKPMHTQNSLDTVSKTLGVGWLEIVVDHPIPLYKNPTDSLPFDILNFKISKPLFTQATPINGKWRLKQKLTCCHML